MSNLLKSRNVFFLLALQFFICQVSAQDVLWEKSFGGKHAEYLYDAIPTPDYGFILAGSSISDKNGNKDEKNKGDLDFWVWKMDEKGDFDWQKSYGGNGVDLLQSIRLTKDAGFILAGTSTSNKGLDKKDNSKGQEDFWIIKLNAKGGEMWQKTIGGSGQEKLLSISQTNDGGYILGGSSSSDKAVADEKGITDKYGKSQDSRGNLDFWVVKLDKDGEIEWQKTIGGKYVDELKSIEQTKDGGYILGGYSNSPASGEKTENNIGLGDYWIVKLDKGGLIEWQKTIGGNKDDNLFVLTQTIDDGYIAGGNSNSAATNSKSKGNSNGTDFWVVKLNFEGTIVWQETYNYGKVDVLTSIIENKDGTFLIGGYAQSEVKSKRDNAPGKKTSKDDEGINDFIALKINEIGEEIWTQTVGSAGADILKKLIETRDGGYLLAGTSNPQSIGNAGGSGNGKQNENKTNALNNTLTDATNDANKAINDTATSATDKINDAIGSKPDSKFKYGLNAPTGTVGLPSQGSSGDINSSSGMNQKKMPASRDKKNNLGGPDFWVVKLRDTSKPKKVKAAIEVSPNPTVAFTNVVVGYEFEKGSATVYDISGRQLQSYEITSRTVPVDLTGLPLGIYIVEIRTDKQNDSVKVIKGTN